MKINYERMQEVLKPFDLAIEDHSIYGGEVDCGLARFLDFDRLGVDDLNDLMKDIHDNNLTRGWRCSIKVLIPILHPYYDEIFGREINKEKLIKVFKKYAGWEVTNSWLSIPCNDDHDLTNKYYIDDLIKCYMNKSEVNYDDDVILSFMKFHEDKFME